MVRTPHQARPSRQRRLRVVAVAASTGGPEALARLARALGASFPAPTIVVLHAEPPFADRFPDELQGRVPGPVHRIRDGMRVPPLGRTGLWVAPPGTHVILRGDRLCLEDPAAADPFRPSADRLFASLAGLGAGAAGVVLSGLDSDGAEGLEVLRRAGGLTLVQDMGSAGAGGMPAAAVRAGRPRHRGPPEALARALWAAAVRRPPDPAHRPC